MNSRERGSVVGYVLVGALMVALLVGGIVLVKNNVGQLGEAQTPQVATNDDKTQQDESPEPGSDSTQSDTDKLAEERARLEEERRKAEEERRAREQNNAASSDSGTNNTPPAPTPPSTSAPTPAPTTPAPVTDQLATTGAAPTAPEPAATADNLPHTGPVEDVAVVLTGASLLIGATVAYARSRSAL